MRKILFYFIVAFSLIACDKGGDPNNAIEVEKGDTNQLVWADNTEGKSGVTFKTTGAWTSTISESSPAKPARAASEVEAPDWISIDPPSGETAGTYSINILLKANFTNQARTATITINCEGQSLSISITQDAKTEEGETPNEHVTGLSLNKNSIKLDKWSIDTLIANVKPTYALNKTVFWSSSNESVVKVDENGVLTPNEWASVGSNATITAITQDGAKSAQCVVTIVNPSANGEGQLTGTDINAHFSKQFSFYYGHQYLSYSNGYSLINVDLIGESGVFSCHFGVPAATKTLIGGDYTFVTDEDGDYKLDFKPGVFVCSPLLEHYKQYPSGGTVKVSIQGDIYTITFNVDTDYNREPGKITGTYIGELRIVEKDI